MAIKKEITIVADTSDAVKDIDKVNESLEGVNETAKKTGDNASKDVDKLGKASKGANKGVGRLSQGFKTLGVAMKSAGIGLILSLVGALASALSRNQKVMNTVNAVLETGSILLTKVGNALVTVYESVASSSENFDALKNVLSSLLTLGVTPLKASFNAIKLSILTAQLAWENSFFGGKDPEKIIQLQNEIKQTGKEIVNIGIDGALASKDLVTNFGEAISEVADIGTKTVDELSKISVKASYEQAQALVEIKNTALIAVAEQQRLVEQYDRSAEIQRQIRDDESKSIPDRTKANNALLLVLDQQEKAMIRVADSQIAAAKAQFKKTELIEDEAAVIDALANKEAILAQIEGFRSEQDINRIALKKEQIELDNTINDAERERQLAKLEFDAEQEKTEIGKLEKQRERLEIEKETILEDLERKQELYALGTQLRVDAEQEYLTRKQEIDNEILNNEKLIAEESKKIAEEKTEKEIQYEEALKSARVNIASNTIGLIGQIAKEGSDLAKGLAVAQATISGFEGVQNAFTTASKSPITTLNPAYPFIQAGLAGAFSAVQIGKILSTDMSGSGGGAVNSQRGAQTPTAPSFNLVEGTGTNQIASGLPDQNDPVRAYVVSGDITTGQSLDRNIQGDASLG